MHKVITIFGLLIGFIIGPQAANAMQFEFVQTSGTAPLHLSFTIGFDDSALSTGYTGTFDYLNTGTPWPAPNWNFGALNELQLTVGNISTDLSNSPSVSCGAICGGLYTQWDLSVNWAGLGSLPSVSWVFNNSDYNFGISSLGGAASAGFDDDCCVAPCNTTGVCHFTGYLQAVDEPRQTFAMALIGLVILTVWNKKGRGGATGATGRSLGDRINVAGYQ